MDELAPHAISFVKSVKAYEMLTIEAAMTGSYRTALEALMTNPLVPSFMQAKGALDELLLVNEAYLPQFLPVIEKLRNGMDPLKA